MRLLLVSDLHYALPQYDWVASVAADFDLVVIAGDHLDLAGFADTRAQIALLTRLLPRIAGQTRLIVSSGNHDLNAVDEHGEKTARWLHRVQAPGLHGDGACLDLDDYRISVCPWWDGEQGRQQVGEKLGFDAPGPLRRWLWVYHAPPSDSPVCWTGTRHYGDEALHDWILRHHPAIVLTGHVHQAPFRKGGSWVDRIGDTWIFNAGRQIGPVPAHITIDTREERAVWSSLAGREAVCLDGPLVRPLAESTD